ncbi:MAG: hypothetical protein JWN59_435 [Sphingomonas bacterium]|nr:hypothetical protein [Sphingomonas bacterium]
MANVLNDPNALRSRGRAALQRGDWAETRRIATSLASNGDAAEALFLAGMADAESGRVSAGLEALGKAAALRPSAEYTAQLARFSIQARRDGAARTAAERAEMLKPEDALTYDTIGCVYARLGDHAAAARMFQQAVARNPDNGEYCYNLGAALGFVGRSEEAERVFEARLAADAGNGRVHYALSGLRRQTPEHNHVARLEAALTAAHGADDRLRIRYALAKEHEDLGQAAPAFAHLHAANEQRRGAIGYRFEQDRAIFDALEHVFGAGDPLIGRGIDEAAPIFVVGMPRTGTTLVDRILSSHPDVQSAGELQAMPLAVKLVAETRTRTIVDPDTIAATRGRDAGEIGRLYLARAREHLQEAKPRFLDKLPANFLYVGYIAQALPNARIVCLRRNPMDTVWSNYKHLFASNSPYYHYSYGLEDTANYYLRFDRLMRFWSRLLPGRVLEIGYEAMIDDQERETRRLLDHCGLSWSDACLDFHRNSAAVATPSAAQVRRPINRDAVGRWTAHAEALGPVRAMFERAGILPET